MTNKNIIRSGIILITSLLLLWVLPWLYTTATKKSYKQPFTYYSSLINDFIKFDMSSGQVKYEDSKGNTYSTHEIDSILPILNYRQLLKDGRLPDSIKGVEVSPQIIQQNNIYFRYSPRKKNAKMIGLYTMFESMSGRVDLEVPSDFFALKDDIHFIDAESNQIDEEKSQMFQQALEKRAFQFPAQWVVGNPSARKAYDEGWFAKDSKKDLYHIKMVNGKPFVKNCNIPDSIDIAYMSTIETAGHLTYGFVFTEEGEVFYLEDTSYKPIWLPIPKININTEQLTIMANMFYWNVYVTGNEQRTHYALDSKSLKERDRLELAYPQMQWQTVMSYIFPCTLSFQSPNSTFVNAYFNNFSFSAIYLNIICVVVLLLVYKARGIKKMIVPVVFVLIAGLCGLIAILLYKPRDNKKKNIIQLK